MTDNRWKPRRLIEEKYRRNLQRLMDLFRTRLDNMTDPYDIFDELRKFTSSGFFRDLAMLSASRMVTALASDSAKTWREAAREGMQGRRIYSALQREMAGPTGFRVRSLIDENAELISTFPLDIAREETRYIQRESMKGRRSKDIAEDLKARFPRISGNRINLIARTETSKASTDLTRARSDEMGLDWYVWRTSKDARVRQSHRLMDGVLLRWTDPASPEELNHEKSYGRYQPGKIFNCRCYPEPLLRIDQIAWPHKVYVEGRIRIMSRAQFMAMNGEGLRKVA